MPTLLSTSKDLVKKIGGKHIERTTTRKEDSLKDIPGT